MSALSSSVQQQSADIQALRPSQTPKPPVVPAQWTTSEESEFQKLVDAIFDEEQPKAIQTLEERQAKRLQGQGSSGMTVTAKSKTVGGDSQKEEKKDTKKSGKKEAKGVSKTDEKEKKEEVKKAAKVGKKGGKKDEKEWKNDTKEDMRNQEEVKWKIRITLKEYQKTEKKTKRKGRANEIAEVPPTKKVKRNEYSK